MANIRGNDRYISTATGISRRKQFKENINPDFLLDLIPEENKDVVSRD